MLPGWISRPIFRWGVKDKPAFREWVTQRLEEDRRHVLVPCHGEIDASPDLGERLVALTRDRF